MFRYAIDGLLHRLSDVIDDMLLGDYNYVASGGKLYADVDYYRRHTGPDTEPRAAPAGPEAAAGRETAAGRDAAAERQSRRRTPGGQRVRGACGSPTCAAALRGRS